MNSEISCDNYLFGKLSHTLKVKLASTINLFSLPFLNRTRYKSVALKTFYLSSSLKYRMLDESVQVWQLNASYF